MARLRSHSRSLACIGFLGAALCGFFIDRLWNWSAKEAPFVSMKASRAWDASANWSGGGEVM